MQAFQWRTGAWLTLFISLILWVGCKSSGAQSSQPDNSSTDDKQALTNSPYVAHQTNSALPITLELNVRTNGNIQLPVSITPQTSPVCFSVSLKITNGPVEPISVPLTIKPQPKLKRFVHSYSRCYCCKGEGGHNTNKITTSLIKEETSIVHQKDSNGSWIYLVVFLIGIMLACLIGCERQMRCKREQVNKIKISPKDEEKKLLAAYLQSVKERPARVLSFGCAAVAVVHLYNNSGTADWIAVALLGLGAAPWLGHVFKSISFKGIEFWPIAGDSAPLTDPEPQQDAQASKQPATEEAKPQPDKTESGKTEDYPAWPNDFKPEEKKVLATLWKYQKSHFPGVMQRRWTFHVPDKSPDHMEFSLGCLLLSQKKLVDLAPTGHIMLSNKGYYYCEQNPEISKWSDTYDHFGN